LELLEERTLLSTIKWVNRDSVFNNFNLVFGSNAERAKQVVDAALRSWQNVFRNFGIKDTLPVSIQMALNTGFGASAGVSGDVFGHPAGGSITIKAGSDGRGAGWFLDSTPEYSEEFRGEVIVGRGMGNIINPYVAEPTAGGDASPSKGIQGDLYSIVVLEMTHVLGLKFDENLLLTKDPNHYLYQPGGSDALDTPGKLYAFRSAHVDALLTSNDGGPGGDDRNHPAHVARPGLENVLEINGGYFRGKYVGAYDSGNASEGNNWRRQPSYLDALILQDVYGYEIKPPTDNSMYVNFDPRTGNLLVRGGPSTKPVYRNQDLSNDEITLSRLNIADVPYVLVNVHIGTAVPGTGPNPLYQNLFPVSMIKSITVKGGDGDDTIKIGTSSIDLMPAVSVDGGAGTDTITVDDRLDVATYTYTVTDFTVNRNTRFGGLTYGSAEKLTLLTGPSAVNVTSTSATTPVTITGNRAFSVDIGRNGSVQSIQGNVTINGSAKAALNVSALIDPSAAVTISNTAIVGLARATISYDTKGLSFLSISLGTAGNTVLVKSTPMAPVALYTGAGSDIVSVNGTSSSLTINGGAGVDTVYLGKNGSLQSITGPLTVTNFGAYTILSVDDSSDPTSRTVTMSIGSEYGTISGLAPGLISYR
jgi:hypothetical protein